DFLDLACLTHYPERSLRVFYITSTPPSEREDFAAFEEWVPENNGLYFSACPAEKDISSPTPDPEPSQPSPHCRTEHKPDPAVIKATTALWSYFDFFEEDLIDWVGEVIPCISVPSTHPGLQLHLGVRIPVSASKSWTRFSGPSAPPRLLDPSFSRSPASHRSPHGSLVPPAPPWSVVDHLTPRDSTPLASPHRSVAKAPPRSSASPWLCGCPGILFHRLRLRQLAPWCRLPSLHHGSSLRRLHRSSLSWL
ncbi:hypothetical protein M9458_002484, partial [Cirrhinus mrigala]